MSVNDSTVCIASIFQKKKSALLVFYACFDQYIVRNALVSLMAGDFEDQLDWLLVAAPDRDVIDVFTR
jgi:hypothetical protein